MAYYKNTIITEAGKKLLRKVQHSEEYLEFLYVKMGSGSYPDDFELEIITDLLEEKQKIEFTYFDQHDETTMLLKFVVSNEELNEGYYIREIGLYANDPDDGEILYSITVAEDGKADYLPEYNNLAPATITMESYLTINNMEKVVVKAGDGIYALAEDLVVVREEGRQKASEIDEELDNHQKQITTHLEDKENPHKVTKSQVGLGNADNTSDINKPVSIAVQEELDKKLDDVGTALKLEGTRTVGHNDYGEAGTYRSVKVNEQGHVVEGTNPTTIAGYAITDAYTKTEVDTKVNVKVDKSEFDNHTGNTTLHITAAERTNWNDANSKKHEHSNKTVLDGITSAKVSNWDSASTNNHTHSNKTVLDGITSTKTTNWDGAATNSHTHSNKSVLDTITQAMVTAWNNITSHIADTVAHITATERTNWNDANSKKHEHSNKTVLDGITSAKVSNWDSASTNNHTHSNKTVLDGITSTKTTNWDGAATNSHTHSNKSVLDTITQAMVTAWNNITSHIADTVAHITATERTNWNDANSKKHEHSNKTVLDGVTSTKVSNWDGAASNSHTHSNKTVLDGITSAKITNWDGAATNSHTHSNKSILDTITQALLNKWNGYESSISELNATMEKGLAGASVISGAAGNIHLPSGLLIQWGRVAAKHSAAGSITISIKFDKAFDQTPMVLTNHATSTPNYASSGVSETSEIGAKLSSYRSTGTEGNILWLAVGYKKY